MDDLKAQSIIKTTMPLDQMTMFPPDEHILILLEQGWHTNIDGNTAIRLEDDTVSNACWIGNTQLQILPTKPRLHDAVVPTSYVPSTATPSLPNTAQPHSSAARTLQQQTHRRSSTIGGSTSCCQTSSGSTPAGESPYPMTTSHLTTPSEGDPSASFAQACGSAKRRKVISELETVPTPRQAPTGPPSTYAASSGSHIPNDNAHSTTTAPSASTSTPSLADNQPAAAQANNFTTLPLWCNPRFEAALNLDDDHQLNVAATGPSLTSLGLYSKPFGSVSEAKEYLFQSRRSLRVDLGADNYMDIYWNTGMAVRMVYDAIRALPANPDPFQQEMITELTTKLQGMTEPDRTVAAVSSLVVKNILALHIDDDHRRSDQMMTRGKDESSVLAVERLILLCDILTATKRAATKLLDGEDTMMAFVASPASSEQRFYQNKRVNLIKKNTNVLGMAARNGQAPPVLSAPAVTIPSRMTEQAKRDRTNRAATLFVNNNAVTPAIAPPVQSAAATASAGLVAGDEAGEEGAAEDFEDQSDDLSDVPSEDDGEMWG